MPKTQLLVLLTASKKERLPKNKPVSKITLHQRAYSDVMLTARGRVAHYFLPRIRGWGIDIRDVPITVVLGQNYTILDTSMFVCLTEL